VKKTIVMLLILLAGFNQANAQDKNIDVQKWLFSSPAGQECDQSENSWVLEDPVKKHVIEMKGSKNYTFYRVKCFIGAYTEVYVYVAENSNLESGYEVIEFYAPEVEYVFSNEDEQVLSSWELVGFSINGSLSNSDYDEETKTLSSYSAWRGPGDAFSSNTYTFIEGQWILTESNVDPTFDGEITPITVFTNKF